MSEAVRIRLPDDAGRLRTLRAGTRVLLSGPVYTARDATHVRLIEDLGAAGVLPFGLEGQVLFYAGPTPSSAGRSAGAVGPTTASRMDAWTPRLLEAGIAATIGKGTRSAEVRRACMEHGAVYLATVGGVAALLATKVVSAETVAYGDLGTEALVRMELEELPAWVALDAAGNDLYEEARTGSNGAAERPAATGEGADDQ